MQTSAQNAANQWVTERMATMPPEMRIWTDQLLLEWLQMYRSVQAQNLYEERLKK